MGQGQMPESNCVPLMGRRFCGVVYVYCVCQHVDVMWYVLLKEKGNKLEESSPRPPSSYSGKEEVVKS